MKILHVAGARPNFMKTAPLMAAVSRTAAQAVAAGRPAPIEQILVHTGQHYDANMSRIFFEDLEMPAPDVFLNVGPGTHAEQTARIMLAFEPVLLEQRPDWVIVVGDVNSTVACALVSSKLGIPVAHVEAGLRSWDRTMPEEINRLLTDQISDLLFTPSRDGDANLLREGIPAHKIHFVGNVMIDSLVRMLPRALERPVLSNLSLQAGAYILVTLHRPSNVDNPATLAEILAALNELGADWPVVFPVHPRTRKNIAQLNFPGLESRVRLLEPFGYLDFLALEHSAGLVLTDSGGIQEETTYLGVPCLTARPNTERPVTITEGTNRLVASTRQAILAAVAEAVSAGVTLPGARHSSPRPDLWDGQAADRIVHTLLEQ